MEKTKKVIILPLDGYANSLESLAALKVALDSPGMPPLLAFVKLNDAVHSKDLGGGALLHEIRNIAEERKLKLGIFLDLKIFDVSETLKNTLKKYASYPPDILTVSAQCSVKGILELRRLLPNTKLAMVSALTDISVEECSTRFGMMPAVKIYNDLQNIRMIYTEKRTGDDCAEPFDLVVCSAHELEFLKSNLPDNYGFIVPGIRDKWMIKEEEHQKRTIGVRKALEMGATYVVMGAQIMRGNIETGVSAEESRRLTLEEIEKIEKPQFEGDPLDVLKNCRGYYKSPQDKDGNFLGPLVAYAGTYNDTDGSKKQFVGAEYFNFAKAEVDPDYRKYFAEKIAQAIKNSGVKYDAVLGTPMGGIMLATEVGNCLHCPTVFAEKKIIALANPTLGLKEKSEITISRHDLSDYKNIIAIEDVCNNFSTTFSIVEAVCLHNCFVTAVACVFNRSGKTEYASIPVLSGHYIPTQEFRQNDQKVAALIKEDKIYWNPKHQWDALLEEAEKTS